MIMSCWANVGFCGKRPSEVHQDGPVLVQRFRGRKPQVIGVAGSTRVDPELFKLKSQPSQYPIEIIES